MKESAVITTVARGPIIDSDALAEALRSGAIGGAGLVRTPAPDMPRPCQSVAADPAAHPRQDVTDPEPLPVGHALWKTPNTIITPHASGHSPHASRRYEELVIENVRRFGAGEELLNVVAAQDNWGQKPKL